VRIVIDYRPALRARTGVGEYIHQVAAALARAGGDDITLFTSSWKDRPADDLSNDVPGARIVDRRLPVHALNWTWHRLGWPAIEALAGGEYDIAHSPHPLLLPSRSAAQIVTVHDLYFMSHPEGTSREIRRDYPGLAGAHARRADRIIVSSSFAAGEVRRFLKIASDRISICPAGAPEWKNPPARMDSGGYILFMGTLDRRKNVGGLLDAYERLLSSTRNVPTLTMAGRAGPDGEQWLRRIAQPPLAGHVEYTGYVPADMRESLFKGAQVFVLPSFEEGFGLPVLEAMSAGVPVVASNRGSLPEVVGDAGILIDPDDPGSLTAAMTRILSDPSLRTTCAHRGLNRARRFTWTQTARDVRRTYHDALRERGVPSEQGGPRGAVQSLDAHRD
jgi:glycosyltransferase involved in cell wall biosynthesis